MLGGLRSAETGLERQACVTETGRRLGVVDWVDWRVWGWRSNVLGTRLEFGRRSAGRQLMAFDRKDSKDRRASESCGLDHGLLFLDRPSLPKGSDLGPHSE